ncbi:MAG: universal stress protein [Treponema sp.]|jgi:nucleotide-binding universal stress UspA family protein|nr:universal stress protein [Treponema sp.]
MLKSLFSHILVAISGSNASIMAAKYAIIVAKQLKCRLSVLYVVDTATIRKLALSKIFVQDECIEYEKSLEANGERYLSFVEELAKTKGIKVERELRSGTVYTEIVTLAAEKKIDLLIVGGYDKERSAREIFSHAHREIMVNAPCTVMLVKEPGIDHLFKQV